MRNAERSPSLVAWFTTFTWRISPPKIRQQPRPLCWLHGSKYHKGIFNSRYGGLACLGLSPEDIVGCKFIWMGAHSSLKG
jgi:hypothetical protein